MTICKVGVAVKNRIHFRSSCILQKSTQIGFDSVLMTVGHIQVHAADPVNENLRLTGMAPITVTVAGNHIKADAGIFFLHSLGIVKMITQMNNGIWFDTFNAPAHKAEAGMGI